MTNIFTIHVLMPEFLLVISAVWIIVTGAFAPSNSGWRWFALLGLLFAAIWLHLQDGMYQELISGRQPAATSAGGRDPAVSPGTSPLAQRRMAITYGPASFDRFGYLVCWGAVWVGVLLVLQAAGPEHASPAPEWIACLLLAVAGLMLCGHANNLVLLFLALELISIPTYVLLFLSRRDPAAREATVKYFFLSILSSALTLYGFSFLYGVAGSTELSSLYRVVSDASHSGSGLVILVRLGLVLSLAGLAFKIALVPMHFYAPDVYQGTTASGAAILASIPKIAGLVVLLRIAAAARPDLAVLGWKLIFVLSVLTMTVGNVLALWQRSVRRLLAYSSIAHAGYLLLGITVWAALPDQSAAPVPGVIMPELAVQGLSATLFYLIVYVVATVGAFAAIGYLGNREQQIDSVDDLAGLCRSHPAVAAALALFMLSLTGLPPLAGFWGKFMLIEKTLSVDVGPTSATAGLSPWFVLLAVVTLLNAAISAGYYLRVVAAMYFRPQRNVPWADGGSGAALATGLSVVLVVGLGFFPGPALREAHLAAEGAAVPLPPQEVSGVLPARHAVTRAEPAPRIAKSPPAAWAVESGSPTPVAGGGEGGGASANAGSAPLGTALNRKR